MLFEHDELAARRCLLGAQLQRLLEERDGAEVEPGADQAAIGQQTVRGRVYAQRAFGWIEELWGELAEFSRRQADERASGRAPVLHYSRVKRTERFHAQRARGRTERDGFAVDGQLCGELAELRGWQVGEGVRGRTGRLCGGSSGSRGGSGR